MFELVGCSACECGLFSWRSDLRRGNWRRSLDSRLALVGANIGYGSLVFFPFYIKRYQAIYFIPFMFAFLAIGVPLFALELFIGQFLNVGPTKAFARLAPILSGVGWGMVMNSLTIAIYYNLYMTESLMLFIQTASRVFSNNSESDLDVRTTCQLVSEGEKSGLIVMASGDYTSDTHLLAFFASWILVAFCISHGLHYSSKIILFVNATPFALLLALIFIKIASPSVDVLYQSHFLEFSWVKLADARMWADAVTHVLFTLGIGFGMQATLSSYNTSKHNLALDVLFVPSTDLLISLMGTFLIYEHLDVADNSLLGLLCSYSTKMFQDKSSVFIYVTLYLFGFATQLAMVETVITAILDQYEGLRRFHSIVVYMTCLALCLPGVCMCYDLSFYNSMKKTSDTFLLICALLTALSAPVLYSHFEKMKEGLQVTLPPLFEAYMKPCWTFVCPISLIVIVAIHLRSIEGKFSLMESCILLAFLLAQAFVTLKLCCFKHKMKEFFIPSSRFRPVNKTPQDNLEPLPDHYPMPNLDIPS